MAVDFPPLDEGEVTDRATVVSNAPCRIGVWGLFDVDEYGAVVDALITRQELLRRLPEADVRLFAPFGHLRPCRLDGGEVLEPLGAWDDQRLDRLAAQLDCVVVGGGDVTATDADLAERYAVPAAEMTKLAPSRFFIDGFGPEREARCPIVWHGVAMAGPVASEDAARLRTALAGRALVTVRDNHSMRELRHAGVDRQIDVVPDAALLLPGLFATEVLDKRLDYLRLMGWYPAEHDAIVVQGGKGMVQWVPELAAALAHLLQREPRLTVVVTELGDRGGDDGFADALVVALSGERVFRQPAVGSTDVAATIAACSGFVGSSRAGIVSAVAYGRPALMLGPDESLADLALETGQAHVSICEPSMLDKLVAALPDETYDPDTVLHLRARVASHFDRMAEIATEAAGRRLREAAPGEAPEDCLAALEARVAALQVAYRVRSDQLFSERVIYADRIALLARDLHLTTQNAERIWRQLNDEVPRRIAAEAEIEALRRTRTFRSTARVRSAYGRLRRSDP